MNQQAVELYIEQQPFADAFNDYDEVMQTKIIFASYEQLVDAFDEKIITDKMVALQSIYMAEGYAEEHAKMKLHGVKSFSLDGMSFTYDGSHISPRVAAMIEKILNPPQGPTTPLFGRLI